MSEKLRDHESYEVEHEETHEHHDSHVERQESHKTPEKELNAAEIRGKLEKIQEDEDAEEQSSHVEPVKAERQKVIPTLAEQKVALNKYLTDIRAHMKSTSRAYSKFIHIPRVDAVSEVAGRTVIRPTAILFAGIFMFIGSAVYLYATYSTDARYNFFVALFLLVGGFVVGLIIELFYKLFFKRDF
jgi:hypothetical protein